MAATRLRRTFNYPSESDDDDAVEEGMDEQDRQTLLSTLSARDTSSTRLYTRLFLLLPLLPLPFYIRPLFSPPTALPSLAAIASLLASAYTLFYLPLPPAARSKPTPPPPSHPAVLPRLAIPVNGLLVAALALAELRADRSWAEGFAIGGGFLPAVVGVLVWGARRELREVDLRVLEGRWQD